MIMYVGVGAGVLLLGIGAFVAAIYLARTLARTNRTLDVLDSQIQGITGTADQTLARLRGVAGSLEGAAASLQETADLAKVSVAPAIINVGATLTGITAGLRRFVGGKTTGEGS